jgi:hypothetical protein
MEKGAKGGEKNQAVTVNPWPGNAVAVTGIGPAVVSSTTDPKSMGD